MGLRWWNRIREDGTNEWVFESLEDMSGIGNAMHTYLQCSVVSIADKTLAGKTDSIVFWYSTYGTIVAWVALFIIGLVKLSLEYLVIVCVALAMNGAQLVGYVKCSRDAKKKLGAMAAGVAGSAFATMARGAASKFSYAPAQTTAI